MDIADIKGGIWCHGAYHLVSLGCSGFTLIGALEFTTLNHVNCTVDWTWSIIQWT